MKKTILFLVFAMMFVFSGVGNAQSLSPSDLASLQSQIRSLLQMVQQLQSQINAIPSTSGASGTTSPVITGNVISLPPVKWCHKFDYNLGLGSRGSEVAALQTALGNLGFNLGTDVVSQTYGSSTALAVSQFQLKYQNEILRAAGLTNPTGFVGIATRTQLNKLFICGVTPTAIPPVGTMPPVTTSSTPASTTVSTTSSTIVQNQPAPVVVGVTVTSPTSGALWHVGSTYIISWKGGDSSQVASISFVPSAPPCLSLPLPCMVAQKAPYVISAKTINSGSYAWAIPNTPSFTYIGKGKIEVNISGISGASGEFTITSAPAGIY